jgi:release factor glutamine methyltransferase
MRRTAPVGTYGVLATSRSTRPRRDGGSDGLDVVRRLVDDAPAWLAPGGAVLVETSAAQASTAQALMGARGLGGAVLRDEDGESTVVLGMRPR